MCSDSAPGGHTALALAMRHPSTVRRLIAASTFFSRDAVGEEFWDGMAKATLEDMPEVYKAADRRLNPGARTPRADVRT